MADYVFLDGTLKSPLTVEKKDLLPEKVKDYLNRGYSLHGPTVVKDHGYYQTGSQIVYKDSIPSIGEQLKEISESLRWGPAGLALGTADPSLLAAKESFTGLSAQRGGRRKTRRQKRHRRKRHYSINHGRAFAARGHT